MMIFLATFFFGVWLLEGVVSLSVSPSFDRHVPPVHNALLRNGPIPLQTLELRPLRHLELGLVGLALALGKEDGVAFLEQEFGR